MLKKLNGTVKRVEDILNGNPIVIVFYFVYGRVFKLNLRSYFKICCLK